MRYPIAWAKKRLWEAAFEQTPEKSKRVSGSLSWAQSLPCRRAAGPEVPGQEDVLLTGRQDGASAPEQSREGQGTGRREGGQKALGIRAWGGLRRPVSSLTPSPCLWLPTHSVRKALRGEPEGEREWPSSPVLSNYINSHCMGIKDFNLEAKKITNFPLTYFNTTIQFSMPRVFFIFQTLV